MADEADATPTGSTGAPHDAPHDVTAQATPAEAPNQPAADARADASPAGGPGDSAEGPDGRNVDLPNFQQVLADVEASGLNLLHDVELHVKIELGRTNMFVEDVLRLAEGSVVELDKLAGDPVDIYVNERLVARGEVLVLNDNFCVRISEIVGETNAEDDTEDDVDSSQTTTTEGAPAETRRPAQTAGSAS
ncbi:MAG: flagellar motor switch protein FliN [Phycisphaerae bacterium]|jgi:flagellar motor switch protein FliN/FliY|nr:flagellar motor switch protein FliN [Phycisphaerae bacterium]